MEKETLYRFFRGEASPEEERRLMEWLDADAENRRTFDRERTLFTALQLFAPRPKARARVSALRPGRRSGALRRLAVPALRIAAVVALAVGISWGVISHREHNWEQLTNRIVVPAGQRINLTLQDGTSVWLNSGSELEYPALFAGATRQVKLRGTALFDVTGNAERPFIVETYACRVEVLGTRFNVRADEQNDEFSTALFRGSVRVTSRDSLHQQVTLRPLGLPPPRCPSLGVPATSCTGRAVGAAAEGISEHTGLGAGVGLGARWVLYGSIQTQVLAAFPSAPHM